MTRMGIANKITQSRYNKAKAELKSPKDDARVSKKYGFSRTTARKIRNTDNFYEYSSTTTTGRRKREHLQLTLAEMQRQDAGRREKGEIGSLIAFAIFMLAFAIVTVGVIIAIVNMR